MKKETDTAISTDKPIKSKTEQKRRESVIFIGCSIPDIVQQFAIFNNGLPEKINEIVKEFPFIKGLIVPVSIFAKARAELDTPESAFCALNERLKEEVIKNGI